MNNYKNILERLYRTPIIGLLAVFIATILLRICIISVGAPHITVDDDTAFEGGFLVWFGHAPPQRMYIESWVYGLTCIGVYLGRVLAGLVGTGIGINLVADAYRDFYSEPEPYVIAYRWLTLVVDLVTIWIVYRIARLVLWERWSGWAAVSVAAMYALSYNILWSGIVARPDSFLAFYCTLGLWLYLLSDAGRSTKLLLWSAVVLGLAAGQKLHGAFLAIFLSLDLLRVHGLRQGLQKFATLAGVSAFFFFVAAGSPLFDPLMYIKLRIANYTDDASPWIEWGEQFITVLRGSGWIVVPFAAAGIWSALARRDTDTKHIGTIATAALGWLLLFASIRQMRAYWMLPALPVFYLMAIYAVTNLRRRAVAGLVTFAMLSVLAAQSWQQVVAFQAAPYNELRQWVAENARDRVFYMLGYDALTAPKNTQCIARTSDIIRELMRLDRQQGVSFTERHVKHWEERTTLLLFDMLGDRFEPGYEFYDFFSAPPDVFARVVGWDRVDILILQDNFDLGLAPSVQNLLQSQFKLVGEKTGAGGGGKGLKYEIYERR